MDTVKSRSMRKWVVIFFWILMIVISFQASDRLTTGIIESSSLTDATTQAGKGQLLYQERFNLTSNTAEQIVVIELNNSQNIQSNQWRNFTLFLTLYLNQTYYPHNYTQVYSEPILLMANQPDIASTFVSKDKTVGLIFLSGLQNQLGDIQGDVKNIRENLTNIINDPQIIYDYAIKYTGNPLITYTLPSKGDIGNIKLILTGSLANFSDIVTVAKQALDSSEIIAVIVVLIILAFVFRSPLGLVIPLISMVSALFPTYLVTWIFSEYNIVQVNDFLPAIIAMIGIAVAIDYNLFNLTRYKEEFHKRKAQGLLDGKWTKSDIRQAELESASIMTRTSGTAVMYSGFSVIIGFVSLLILRSEFANGLAIAVSIVIVFSVITARTLTPAILGLFGRYIDWPDITTRSNQAIKDIQEQKVISNIWVKWSNLVMKHAWTFLILGILFIVPVTFLSLQTNLGFDTVKNLPKGTESRDGYEILNEKFDLGSANPYQVLIDTGVKNGVFNASIINAVNHLGEWAKTYSEKSPSNGPQLNFSSVNSVSYSWNRETGKTVELNLTLINQILNMPDIYDVNHTKPAFMKNFNATVNNIPASAIINKVNTSVANSTILISITSNLDQGSSDAWGLVVKIRTEVAKLFDPLGVKTYVFGFAASFYDTEQSMYGNTPIMLAFAVTMIFIALMILFRSLLLPAKAIITISGSILFSLGTLVYIFQQGNFLWLINGEKVGGITFFIPIFLFTIVLGLGMDYSIFIISRIREEYEKGTNAHDAVGIGLSKTAYVVTNAAVVMIATFLVFAFTPILFLKTVGVAMAVAILIDASVSRMILLPSAMALVGKWNWYLPNWIKKIIPNIKLVH